MKRYKEKTYLLIILGLLIAACHFKSESSRNPSPEVPEAAEVSNKIVLIFQNCPPDINTFRWRENLPYGFMSLANDISYVDSALSYTYTRILLKKAPDSDTITILDDTNNKVVVFTHLFNMDEYAIYLFRKGDTVLFTYNGNIPSATILNRETSFPENNYNIFIREKVTNNRLSATSFYGYYLLRDTSVRGEQSNYLRLSVNRPMDYLCEKYQILTRKQALDMAVEEVIHEYKLQDTLHASGLLSDFDYDYRRLMTASYLMNYFVRDTSLIQNPEYKILLAEIDLSDEKFEKIISLVQLLQKQLEMEAKVNEYLKVIKPIIIDNKGSGGTSPRYYQARFGTIGNLDFLSAKAKRSFLINELKKIVEIGDRNDIEKYCDKYLSITGDMLFVSNLLAENKMDFGKSDDLLLIDRDNRQTNLQEVLAKNRGKFVYVDFWASWCAPCKASMPDAKLLREEYKDRDITFLYLAFNDEVDRWKEDEQKMEVNYLSESYFITNSKTAHLIADLQVRTIPRYLLYDKNGELVHLNAPAPHGDEIRYQLDKYLKK